MWIHCYIFKAALKQMNNVYLICSLVHIISVMIDICLANFFPQQYTELPLLTGVKVDRVGRARKLQGCK